MNQDSRCGHPVYAVVGSDRFLRNEAVRALVGKLDADDQSLGPTTYDGTEASLADVLDDLRTLSLLGGTRLTIVDSADAFITANRKKVEAYCESPSGSGVLILACNAMAKNTRLFKIISKTGRVITCENLRGRQTIDWVVTRGRSMYDKAVSGQVAARLVELVGNSPGALDGELSKLSAYVGSRDQITGSDVDALTGQHREEKVFAVTDAMSVGDTSRALAHWEQVLATDRAAPGRAIAGLAWGIRRLLSARRDLDRGAHLMSVARRMYTEPHVLEQRLKNLSRARLETQLQDLCAADLAVKTGGSRLGSAIEQFIVRHSQSETQPANKR